MEGSGRGLRVYFEELRKTTKDLSQYSMYPDQDLHPGPTEYEAETLIENL
jgi:hypothetical protein